MKRWWLAVLLTMIAGPVSLRALQAEDPLVLNDFRSPGAIEKLSLRAAKGELMATDDDQAPAGFLVDYEAGEERWPALILRGEALPEKNWILYDRLTVKIYNPAATEDDTLQLCIQNQGGSRLYRRLKLSPGWNTVTLPVNRRLTTELPVEELHFFLTDPKEPRQYGFADLTLHGPLHLERLKTAAEWQTPYEKSLRQPASPDAGLQQRREAVETAYAEALADFKQAGAPSPRYTAQVALQSLLPQLERLRGLIAAQAELAASPDGVLTAWADGITRVFPEQGLDGKTPGRLSLAANETEGIQLCLMPQEDWTNVSVRADSFRQADGTVLDAGNIAIASVGFVNTVQPCYPVEYTGWTPDIFLDYLPQFEVKKQRWQPVWLDVRAPADQPPGVYDGIITVTADQLAEPLQIPLTIEVWPFVLPEKNSFPLAFNEISYGDFVYSLVAPEATPEDYQAYLEYVAGDRPELDGNAEQIRLAVENCEAIIAAHRVPTDNLYRNTVPTERELQERLDNRNTMVNLLYVHGLDALPKLRKILPAVERNDWWDNVYIYGFDEVSPEGFALMRDVFGAIRAEYPKLRTMTTAYDHSFGPDSRLDELIDIWVPLTPVYLDTTAEAEAARQRGREIWYYVCCFPVPPSANFMIECPATGTRLLPGFMARQFHSDGLLYYQLTFWRTNQTRTGADGTTEILENHPWPEPLRGGPYTNMNGKSWADFNGDGMLLYPVPGGAVPSLRLKFLRDGLEDYEYLQLLESLVAQAKAGAVKMADGDLEQAEKLLAPDWDFIRSDTEYTRDSREILRRRRQIGELLARYGNSR